VNVAHCAPDLAGRLGSQEVHIGRSRHDHPHLGGDPLDALIVAQLSHAGPEQLVTTLKCGPALKRAAHAGAELEDLDLHGHDPGQEQAQQRDPGASADDLVKQ
jgi:hypothetical protein